jgi:DNA repair exonuclease SbcCD ATPase subunit
VQLTELLFQKVKDLPGQGQLALKPGYVAVVSRSPSLRAALIAPLCPAPDDQKRLSEPPGPTRVGVGVLGGDGTSYRLLRELGGSRQLLKFNTATGKYAALTDDQLEIDSFLRVECGMPTLDAYTHFFVLEVNELPSLRAKSAAAVSEAYVDVAQVQALKEELVLTQTFEGMQDRLFKISQRLQELSKTVARLREAETDAELSEHELGRSPWSKEQIADLTARAGRAKDELKRREEALADIAKKKERLASTETPVVEKFASNPWFGGGLAGGVLLDVVAFFVKRPVIALFGLLPYLGALIAVLRWIEADEASKESVSVERELKEREHSVLRNYEAEHAPLKAALKAASLERPEDLVALFREREAVTQRRDQAQLRLLTLQQDPEIAQVGVEVPQLEEEKQKLDTEVLRMGFTRSMGDIESDLKRAMGVSNAKSKSSAVPEAEVPKQVLDRAAEILSVHADELFQQIGPRLTAYLGALTDQRVTIAKRDEKGLLILGAADGRSGPYTGLPPLLRDLVYSALRLALVERVASVKKLPVVIDDAFGTLEPAKRALVAKMLKGISTQGQVIHRVVEPPPPGTADLVLQT